VRQDGEEVPQNFGHLRRKTLYKRIITALSFVATAMLAFGTVSVVGAAGAVLEDVYPEQRADGKVYSVGRWSDGSYTDAVSEYPELRGDGSVVYVYAWNNGSYSIALREYSEQRADGGVYLVRQFDDGHYVARQIQTGAPTTVAAAVAASNAPANAPSTGTASRESLAAFMNHLTPTTRQLNVCSTALNTLLPRAPNNVERTGIIDRWVKCFEPHMPTVAALEAPPIPFAQAFVKGYKEAILLEFDAGKRLNYGIVTNNPGVVDAALDDLERSGTQEEQAFWELNAALWQYGLKYDEKKGQYGTWY
jgi:hypothetical protein